MSDVIDLLEDPGVAADLAAKLLGRADQEPPSPAVVKTADDLEWATLLGHLAERCHSEPARALATALPGLDDPALVARRLAEVEEACSLLATRGAPGLAGLGDVAEHLDRAERGGVLVGEALRDIANLARIGDEARRPLADSAERAPLLASLGARLRPTGWLAATIGGAIESDGTIMDSASAELGSLRSQAHGLDRNLHRHVEKLLLHPEIEPHLQDRFFTLRDGRYVFPVKASEQSRVPGIVHGKSGSGQTFFIEPVALVDYNNRLKMAQIAVEEEELRILAELSAEVAEVADDLRANFDELVYLDLTLAAGRLATAMRARRPQLIDASRLWLINARHPLLALREEETGGTFSVVPNDIGLGTPTGAEGGEALGAAPVIVISGPNTGGKTVTLKTVGLCALMVRAGLLIPVDEGSLLPVFGAVFADIGDEQSLAEDLSSFSGHLANIKNFLPLVRGRCLVLLDELFSGTDPVQGAALSAALLEELAERGALVAVTTHSEPLKQFALAHERFDNASMGFDLQALQPTFALSLGVPGSSHALEIARRMALPDGLLERAQVLLGGAGESRLEQTLRALEGQRQRYQQQERAALVARGEAERAERRYAQKLERLEEAALEDVDARLQRVFQQIREAEILLKRHRRSLSKVAEEPLDEQALEAMAGDVHRLGRGLSETRETRDRARIRKERTPLPDEAVAVDEAVWVRPVRSVGTVVEVDRGRRQARVRVGLLKTVVSFDDIYDVTAAEGEERAAHTSKPRPEAPLGPAPIDQDAPPPQHRGNTADLRGMRVDEALGILEHFLDDAYSRQEQAVYVIHGHGTGALKRAVREHLQHSSYVRSHGPAARHQGGDGCTLAELR